MIIKTAIFQGSSTNVDQRPKLKAPEFAFIGRSNVGKSSLINMLCGRKDLARTSSMPGKTISVNHFLVNGKWYLVDLPGYGFAKASKKAQAALKAMIEDYVSHSEELAMLFILIDSRHELQEVDRNFISAVSEAQVPFTVIMTKCDKLSRTALAHNMAEMEKALSEIMPGICILPASSEKREGKEQILGIIEAGLKADNTATNDKTPNI